MDHQAKHSCRNRRVYQLPSLQLVILINSFLSLYLLYSLHGIQLNFARFRQNLKGFHKTTTNVQVVGFTERDSHRDVLRKGAEGLGLKCNLDFLSLICSGGEVPDSPINGVPWTLGEYIKLHGGNQNRSKKVWGINIPIDVEDDGMKSHDPVINYTHLQMCKL